MDYDLMTKFFALDRPSIRKVVNNKQSTLIAAAIVYCVSIITSFVTLISYSASLNDDMLTPLTSLMQTISLTDKLLLSLLLPVFSLLLLWLSSLIYHLFALMFGGKGSTTKIFRGLGHAYPVNLLSLIPFVGLFATIYWIVMSVFVISESEEISTGRAVLSVLIPFFLFLIIIIALTVMILLTFNYPISRTTL